MRKIIIASFLLSLPAWASSQKQQGAQVLLTIENDFLGIGNEDENYTGGAKLEVQTPGIPWKCLPFYRFKGDSVINIQRFGLGGTAYTPQRLDSREVVLGDRPYASLTFFNIGSQSINKANGISIQSDLVIGGVGLSGPGEAQSYVHRHHWFGTTRPDPQGWDNQIGFNGKFVVNYNMVFKGPLYQRSEVPRKFKLFAPFWVGRADIGTYMTNVQAGVQLNFLLFNMHELLDYRAGMPVYMIKGSAGSSSIESHTSHPCRRFNLFFESTIRYALHNTTLEGMLFGDKSVYTIYRDEVTRLLFEVNAGANFVISDIFYLRYTLWGRSMEYDGGKPFHWWGSFTLGVSCQRWYRGRNS